jgi:hypothetical protein
MASLDAMAEQLDAGLALTGRHDTAALDDPAWQLEARELGLRCTQGMLMCLDVDHHRLPLVLTEVFGLDTARGAEVLAISAPAYRQRLSRGRRRLEAFIEGRCGWIDPGAACSCPRQALAARRLGTPAVIRWSAGETAQQRRDALDGGYEELALMQRIASALRRAPQWTAPQEVTRRLLGVIAASPMLGGARAAREA